MVQLGIAGGLFSTFILLIVLEHLFPLRERRRPTLSRAIVNISLAMILFSLSALIVRPSSLHILSLSQHHEFGLLFYLPHHWLLQSIAGFLLLDLTYYYWHQLNHRVPLLWRFHNVHHIDQDVDVTTAVRFHFMEILLSLIFRVLQIGLLGIALPIFLVYEVCFQIASYFHHSNLKLPLRFERGLNLLFVTPRMHGIHHSNIVSEMNNNYGVVFSIWDRLHKTLVLNIPQSWLDIGVPAYSKTADNQFLTLLMTPFKKQREYFVVQKQTYYKRSNTPAREQKLQMTD